MEYSLEQVSQDILALNTIMENSFEVMRSGTEAGDSVIIMVRDNLKRMYDKIEEDRVIHDMQAEANNKNSNKLTGGKENDENNFSKQSEGRSRKDYNDVESRYCISAKGK